jgi:3-hydroxyisobutyrate dehydrogenase-like beta-hydroxyacid dehydrogenase
MLSSTLFAAPIYKIYGAMIAERRYTPPGFAAELGLKDVRLVQDAAEAKGLSLPLADLAEASLESLLAARTRISTSPPGRGRARQGRRKVVEGR